MRAARHLRIPYLQLTVLDTRRLTPRELVLLKSVFGSAVDYALVRLQKGGWLTWRGQAVAWANRVRFPADRFRNDFTTGHLGDAVWLVHELCHVWQWQNVDGYYPLKAAREHLSGTSPYLYTLDPDKKLLDYGWEQQAKIVEDWTRRCIQGDSPEQLADYTRVIRTAIPAPEWAPPAEAWASIRAENIA